MVNKEDAKVPIDQFPISLFLFPIFYTLATDTKD